MHLCTIMYNVVPGIHIDIVRGCKSPPHHFSLFLALGALKNITEQRGRLVM